MGKEAKVKKRRRLPEDEPKRKPKSSKMAEWKEQWGGGDDDDESDELTDKLKVGKNTRRVLPNRDPEEPWFVAYAMHFQMGPDGQDSFRCIEPGGPFGHSKKLDKKRNYRAKKCPACKKYCKMKTKARAFEFGSKKGIAFWREHVAPWRAKHQFVMADMKPKSKSERKKTFVLRVGLQIAKPLMEAYYDEDGGGDFTDPVRGRNIVIKKEQLSKRTQDIKYTVTIQPDRTKLENWKKLRKKLPDLNSFLPEELSPDAIQAIIDGDGDDDGDEVPRRKKGKFRSRDDGDADMDDDVEDDDDEEGSSRKLKPRKRRREEDEDVDPDAEEEDDDEDEGGDEDVDDEDDAPKKKKSKMRERLARRAEQDDDDEDLDDEDEDVDDEDDDDDD